MTSSLFSGGNVAGVEQQIENLIPSFQNFAGQSDTLGGIEQSQGVNDIYPTALDQYQKGAAGQLTDAQQAAVNQTKQQMDLATSGTYANLGFGGSTMKTQDLDANAQKSLAQTVGFSALDEELGLKGLSTALGFEQGANTSFGTAASSLGQGANALAGVGNLAAGQQAAQMQALGSIGSALGSKF